MTDRDRDHSLPNFMEVVAKRRALLERLMEGSAYKRDLVDEFDHSRSTVDRAIRELADEGLVDCEEGRYRATAAGAVGVRAHRQFVSLADDIDDARDLLEQLTADEPLEPMLLEGADVARATDLTRVELFEPIQCRLREADEIATILPELADIRHLDIFRQQAETGVRVDLVLGPEIYETLQTQRPRTLRQLGMAETVACHVTETPPCGMILTERDGEATATVLLFDEGRVIGTITNDTAPMLAWVRQNLADLRGAGREVTDEMRELSTTPDETARSRRGSGRRPRLPRPVRAGGFIRLSPAYFNRREPVDPATAYRSGLGLVAVAAGYAADRTVGDTAQRVTTRLVDELAAGQSKAIVGPPGVGKSTVCKQVAYRWYEADRGPVFYRLDDAGRGIEHPAELLELARTAEGHALIVVEGATHPNARPVIDLAEDLADDEVSILFDARRDEWDTFGTTDAIEPFRLPEIDETDCARLIETVRSLGATPELPDASELLTAGRETAHEAAVDVGVTLGVIHRLATLLDPLATGQTGNRTPLVADVEAAIESTITAGSEVFDIALAVQACIVADQPISVDLLYGLHEDPQMVDTTIELLTDRALFPPVTDGTYRTVHASWAVTFIERAIEQYGAAAVHDRLMPRLTAVLALADDTAARNRLRDLVGGATPLVDCIEANPHGWADGCVERLQTAPIEYPKIAPAFNSGDGFSLPAAASDGLALQGRYRRAQAAERGGELDRALREAKTVKARLADDATVPPGHTREGMEIRAELLTGRIHRNQGHLATAEELLTDALEAAENSNQDSLAGRCRYELGDIARQRSQLEEAATLFEACIAHDNPRIRSEGLRGLGRVEHMRGNYPEAATHLEESLTIDERLGNRNGILQTLNMLGANAVARGDIETAGNHFRRSIDLARRLGERKAEAEALNNLGEVLSKQGKREAAREYYERALEVAREVGVSRSIAIALCNLGNIQCAEDEPLAARDRFEEALAIGERLESPKLQLHAHHGLATVARTIGDHDAAVDRYDRATTITDEIGNERIGARIRAEQASAIAARGDRQKALDQLADVTDTVESLDALTDAIDAVEDLIDICLAADDHEGAAAACRNGIDIATAADQDDQVRTFEQRLAEIET